MNLYACNDRAAANRQCQTRYAPLFALALAIVTAAACGPRIPNYDYAQEPDPRTAEYILGVSDEIAITVWKNPELSTSARVRPDGTVTMPLAGDLIAAGRTTTDLKSEILEKLSGYMSLNSDEVTVAVVEVNSYRFTVSGEVERPGIYTSNHYVTIAEALAMAGGFTRFAERGEVSITRRDHESGEERRIPINYEAIAQGVKPEMNLIVLPGDSIYVP